MRGCCPRGALWHVTAFVSCLRCVRLLRCGRGYSVGVAEAGMNGGYTEAGMHNLFILHALSAATRMPAHTNATTSG